MPFVDDFPVQVDALKVELKDAERRAREGREDAIKSKRDLEDFVARNAERQIHRMEEEDRLFQVVVCV